ncbi:MAG: adenylyl-sulfate kinase [Actinobacteria bacterium]|nr:adenylyl-sulfate kinase [Actinomycetota bacterium]
MVLWITGLSASGKTTIGRAFLEITKDSGAQKVFLDGDSVREMFGGDLGYDENSRIKHIQRVQRLAKFLTDQGIDVVVAALYSNQEILAENRKLFDKYFEVYLKADINFLKIRENKSLYTKSQSGEITDVVGVDIKWQVPNFPDLIINTNILRPPDELALEIYNAIKVKTDI